MPVELLIQDTITLTTQMGANELERLVTIGEAVLTAMQRSTAGVTIIIEADDAIQAMNAQYRGIDRPTDVLTFAAEPLPDDIGDADDADYLGDILIAYNYTLHQATTQNHAPPDEFALMVVHGLLHLLGFDHDTPDSQKAMWAEQQTLLDQLGIPIVVPDFVHGRDDEP